MPGGNLYLGCSTSVQLSLVLWAVTNGGGGGIAASAIIFSHFLGVAVSPCVWEVQRAPQEGSELLGLWSGAAHLAAAEVAMRSWLRHSSSHGDAGLFPRYILTVCISCRCFLGLEGGAVARGPSCGMHRRAVFMGSAAVV